MNTEQGTSSFLAPSTPNPHLVLMKIVNVYKCRDFSTSSSPPARCLDPNATADLNTYSQRCTFYSFTVHSLNLICSSFTSSHTQAAAYKPEWYYRRMWIADCLTDSSPGLNHLKQLFLLFCYNVQMLWLMLYFNNIGSNVHAFLFDIEMFLQTTSLECILMPSMNIVLIFIIW